MATRKDTSDDENIDETEALDTDDDLDVEDGPDEDIDDDGDDDFGDGDAFLDGDDSDDDDSLLEPADSAQIQRRSGAKGLVVEGIPRSRLEKAEVATEIWEKLVGKFDNVESISYSIKTELSVHDVVEHKNFGRGFVIDAPGPNKVEVLFENGLKKLVHGK